MPVIVETHWPLRIKLLLGQFDLSRATREKTGFQLPHPGREDRHPSVRLTVTSEGKIVLVDRTGRPTLEILHAIGAAWPDLFPADEAEKLELLEFAHELCGGASSPTPPSLIVE